MKENQVVSERELNAYIDGELTGPERDEFEALISRNSALSDRIEGYRRADETVRQALKPIEAEGVPIRYLETLLAGQERRSRRFRLAAAAALVAFVLGGSIGWYASGSSELGGTGSRNTVRLAQSAHRVFVSEVRHPVEVTAADYDHLVGWLSKRLGYALSAPDFGRQDFELIGGRLLPGAETAAAQFMYENRAGERITFYVARNPDAASTAFRISESPDLRTFYWLDGPLGFALSGNIDERTLHDLAMAAYDQLSEADMRSESR